MEKCVQSASNYKKKIPGKPLNKGYPGFLQSFIFHSCRGTALTGFHVKRFAGGSVGGKMILPPHGKENFHTAVRSFLHYTVRSFCILR